jgi:hypothetical protein
MGIFIPITQNYRKSRNAPSPFYLRALQNLSRISMLSHPKDQEHLAMQILMAINLTI